MVIASHAVFATYGFWPPNDPRGSWSDKVWADHLKRFGIAQKVSTRKSIAHQPFDRKLRSEIDAAMKYPKVSLNQSQRVVVGDAIKGICATITLRLYALAVLPDHVHFVPQRHRYEVEQLIGLFKRAASRALIAGGLHPFQSFATNGGKFPTAWVDGGWKRYLETPAEIQDAMEYVRANPAKARLAPQHYDWLTPLWEETPRGRGG